MLVQQLVLLQDNIALETGRRSFSSAITISITHHVSCITAWGVISWSNLNDICADNIEVHNPTKNPNHLSGGPTTWLGCSGSYVDLVSDQFMPSNRALITEYLEQTQDQARRYRYSGRRVDVVEFADG